MVNGQGSGSRSYSCSYCMKKFHGALQATFMYRDQSFCSEKCRRVQMKMDAKLKQLPTAVDAPPKRRPVKRHRSFHRGLQDSAHSHSQGSSDSVGRGVESTSPYLAGTDPTLSPHIPGDLKVSSDKPRSKSSSDMTRNTSVSTNDSMDVAQAKIERVQGGGEGSTCRLMQCVVM